MEEISFKTKPFANYLANNPIVFDVLSDTDHSMAFDVRIGGEIVYSGLLSPLFSGGAYEASASIADVIRPYFLESKIEDGSEIFSEVSNFFLDVMVVFSQEESSLSHPFRVYRGGIDKGMLRYLRENGTDIFEFKFLNIRGNFFLTTRTYGKHIVLRETEVLPLYFAGTSFTVVTEYGDRFPVVCDSLKVYSLNLDAIRMASLEQYGHIPCFFEIMIGVSLVCDIRITEPARVPHRLVVEFINSFSAPERLEITGKCTSNPEFTGDDIYEKYDLLTDDYLEQKNGRTPRREIIEAEFGYKTPQEMRFTRDMLQSDIQCLVDESGYKYRVVVTSENYSHDVFPIVPGSIPLRIRHIESDPNYSPGDFMAAGIEKPVLITVDTSISRNITINGADGATINWGDGSVEYIETANASHMYEPEGTYTIRMYDKTSLANGFLVGQENVTGIVVPSSVVRIGVIAFYNCINLQAVDLPASGCELAGGCFANCSKLEAVRVPDGNTLLRAGNIAAGAQNERGMFHGCASLAEIILPSSLVGIGHSAFRGCSPLVSITIPDGVAEIGAKCFAGCSSLREISLPESCRVGEACFYNCFSLRSLKVPEGTFELGYENVERIGFCQNCASLAEVILPSSLARINHGAFRDCPLLVSIAIPDGVAEIGANCFAGCSSLEEISLPESCRVGESCFYNCSSLRSLRVPEGTTRLDPDPYGHQGFCRGCSSLVEVMLPSSLTGIGNNAFMSCVKLDSIKLKAIEPPVLQSTNAFENNASGRIIYVPAGSLAAYQSTTNWTAYAAVIQEYA